MKFRNGFISNSSSSSFVILYEDDQCKHCGRGSTLQGLVDLNFCAGDCTEAHCRTLEDAEEIIVKECELSGSLAEAEITFFRTMRKRLSFFTPRTVF